MKLQPRATGTPWDILLVDPDRDDARAFAAVLESLGCRVEVLYSAIKGVEAAKETLFDAVFSVISMRRMDAYELAYELRGDPRTERTPFILLAGKDEVADESTCEKLHIQHTLGKPVEIGAAFGVLREVLPHQNVVDDVNTDAVLHAASLRLEALGFETAFQSDGSVAGRLELKHVEIILPTTSKRVDTIVVAARGSKQVELVEPALMTRLPAVSLAKLEDAETFERAVEAAWKAWLKDQRGVLELASSLGLRFREQKGLGILLQSEHDGRKVELSVRDRYTLVLERWGDWQFPQASISPIRLVQLPRSANTTRAEIESLVASALEERELDLGALAELPASARAVPQPGGMRELDPSDLKVTDPITSPGRIEPFELETKDFIDTDTSSPAPEPDEDPESNLFTEDDFKVRRPRSDTRPSAPVDHEQEFELEEGSILELDDD